MLTGQFECQAVKFAVHGDIEEFSHCHCSQCRRLHGAAFATFAAVEQSAFSYSRGVDLIKQYRAAAAVTRHFCGVCSSMIMSEDTTDSEVFDLSMSILSGQPNHPTVITNTLRRRLVGSTFLTTCRNTQKALNPRKA